MYEPRNPLLAGVALLTLAAAAWSSANAQATSNQAVTGETRDLAGGSIPANGADSSGRPGDEICNQEQRAVAGGRRGETNLTPGGGVHVKEKPLRHTLQ